MFACLSTGDMVAIKYNDKVLRLEILVSLMNYYHDDFLIDAVNYCKNTTRCCILKVYWPYLSPIQIYELCVLETKPGKAVSIIECDMNVSKFILYLRRN